MSVVIILIVFVITFSMTAALFTVPNKSSFSLSKVDIHVQYSNAMCFLKLILPQILTPSVPSRLSHFPPPPPPPLPFPSHPFP